MKEETKENLIIQSLNNQLEAIENNTLNIEVLMKHINSLERRIVNLEKENAELKAAASVIEGLKQFMNIRKEP